MKSFYEISLSDLLPNEKFKEAFTTNNNKEIRKILWLCGLDIFEQYELVECTHRNRRKQIVTCQRYEGSERQDDIWMKSKMCTTENKIAASDFMREELQAVNRQGFGRTYEKIAARYVQNGGDKDID